MTYRIVIKPEQKQKQEIILTSEQEHYLNRVLRLKQGDRLIVIDGLGKCWLAQLYLNRATIIKPIITETELPVSITLIISLPKGNGFDEVVRCCTEIGVNIIIPVISERTLLKPSPQKLRRWHRIATEAAEQSERLLVPEILEPVSFSATLDQIHYNQKCYLCVARDQAKSLLAALSPEKPDHITIITGPEGGWTPMEREKAIALGCQPVSLGKRILRAITAPIVALSLVAGYYEK